jgi:hypothetical protein
MALKNLPSVVRTLGVKANPPCVSTPGKYNSCDSPSGSPIRIPVEGEDPGPCCGEFDPSPFFFNFFRCESSLNSDWILPFSITCPVEFTITANPTVNDPRIQIGLYINDIFTNDLTPGIGYTFTINPGDFFYVGILGSSLPNEVSFSLYNETCRTDYGIIGYLNPLRSECTVFPAWPNNSFYSETNYLLSNPFTYNGGTVPITIDLNFMPTNFNPNADAFLYYGSDPLFSNNTSTPLVLGGAWVGTSVITLNPGDSFWIEVTVGNDDCANFDLEIANPCLCPDQQYWYVPDIQVNALAC